MNDPDFYIRQIQTELSEVSTADKAEAMRRYFPHGINCMGAKAPDIKLIVQGFHNQYSQLTADEVLSIAEQFLNTATFQEEKLVSFALINKFVKKNYSDDLLLRFEYWLENYANNWALVDDLCLKTIYQFLLGRPHLIEQTQRWAHSDVSWCRRASNAVWVKFIKRKIGNSTYCLNTDLVFKNCDLLLRDSDEFVQKSIGWLLKSTAQHHEKEVIAYLRTNYQRMERATLRYAIEKLSAEQRASLLAGP